MSLNWQLPENSSEALFAYKYRYEGEETEEMHPILHRLIFLTMTLCADLTGGDKAKADVKKRVNYITRTSPDLTTLTFGEDAEKCEVLVGGKWTPFRDAFNPSPRFDKDGKVNGWSIVINDEVIDRYWGLSTNADRKPFNAWFTHFNKRTLELMERGY